MGRPMSDYIPHLVTGYMIWTLLQALVIEGKDAFVSNAAAIREIPVPRTVYVYKLLWKNLIILGFNSLVYVAVACSLSGVAVSECLPGRSRPWRSSCSTGFGLAFCWGSINVRYRDLGQLIPNAMRLAFFVTPILWYPDSVTGFRTIFVDFNPFYYFIEVAARTAAGAGPKPSDLVRDHGDHGHRLGDHCAGLCPLASADCVLGLRSNDGADQA